MNSARMQPAFGIAQIGKSFRNEITPGNFMFRTREFEQMEIEFFVKPGDDDALVRVLEADAPRVVPALRHQARAPAPARARHRRARALRQRLRRRRVRVPVRLVGARGHRQPHRLRPQAAHAESRARTSATSTTRRKERYVPYVIEPSAGADRATLAFLVDAYDEDGAEDETRAVLRLHPALAPVKVAIFPLMRKDGHAREGAGDRRAAAAAAAPVELRPGRRRSAGATAARTRSARRSASPSTHETHEDDTVTLRDRDSMEQAAHCRSIASRAVARASACSPAAEPTMNRAHRGLRSAASARSRRP